MRYRERERERVEHFIVLFRMQNKILNLTSVSTAQIVQLQPNDKLWLCSSSGYPLHSITKDTHLNSWLHAISMFSSKESGTRTNRVQRRKIVICVHCALTSRNFSYRNKKKIQGNFNCTSRYFRSFSTYYILVSQDEVMKWRTARKQKKNGKKSWVIWIWNKKEERSFFFGFQKKQVVQYVCITYFSSFNGMGIKFSWNCRRMVHDVQSIQNWQLSMRETERKKINSFIWILWWNVSFEIKA